MLVIRLLRTGKKNQPSFKIVVTQKENPPRGGRFVEQVGIYNPLTKERVLKKERILYWLSQGAQPSHTVYNLLVAEKILEGSKIAVHKKAKERGEKSEGAPKMEEKPKEESKKDEAPESQSDSEKNEKPQSEPSGSPKGDSSEAK